MKRFRTPQIIYLDEFVKLKDQFKTRIASFFDESTLIEARAEILEAFPFDLIEKFGWAVPDERALRIIASFGPVVEIGCGKGYWAHLLSEIGVDIVAFDIKVPKKTFFKNIQKGTPNVLEGFKDRTLLLCYADDYEGSDESMALECLNVFEGEYIITVGETFGRTLMGNAWGKSFAPEFQIELRSSFHLLIQVPLPSWFLSSDCLQ